MESITGRTERWRYRSAEWKPPVFVQFLDAPDNLSKGERKMWKQRGYGLWIGEKVAIMGEYNAFQVAEKNVLKSRIAECLMERDKKFFLTLQERDSKRLDFLRLYSDNSARLQDRETVLLQLLEGAQKTVPNKVEELDYLISDASAVFVRDCLRPYDKAINRDELLVGNLESRLRKIKAVSDELRQHVVFPPGVKGTISLVQSQKTT